MRHLILLFSFLCFLNLSAQSNKVSVKKDSLRTGLSKIELKTAEELYVKMMQSQTYIQMHKSMDKDNEMTNGLQYPPELIDATKKEEELKAIYKKWLTDNLSKTKYKSVDEGMKSFIEGADLYKKVAKENAELYVFMRRATRDQLAIIMEPERQRGFDMIYEVKKH